MSGVQGPTSNVSSPTVLSHCAAAQKELQQALMKLGAVCDAPLTHQQIHAARDELIAAVNLIGMIDARLEVFVKQQWEDAA